MEWRNCKDIFVYIEHDNHSIKRISLEVLYEARRLADILGENVIAVVLGDNISSLAQECVFFGADKVLYADDKCLEQYTTDIVSNILENVISEIKPNIVLIGGSYEGKDIAPHLAVKLNTGLTADCTKLDIKHSTDKSNNENILLMTRPTYGGNIIATIECSKERPQMATIGLGIMDKAKRDDRRTGNVQRIYPTYKQSRVEVLETVEETIQNKPINEEKILVVGGAGIKKEAMFENLFTLAKQLKGGVGVSRALVDKHWAVHEKQVGQTGTTVKADLYISFGVSGAIQHITGMEDSQFIIAVNSDSEAPIFKFVDVGIVGNLEEILPLLIEKIKTRVND